jgi:hypothetical protein
LLREQGCLKIFPDKKVHYTYTNLPPFTVFMAGLRTPIYSGILCCIGADNDKIIAGDVTTATMPTSISRPYGLYLDKVRKWFGVKQGYCAENTPKKRANGNIYKHP